MPDKQKSIQVTVLGVAAFLTICCVMVAVIHLFSASTVFAQAEPDSSDSSPPSIPTGLSVSSRTAYSIQFSWSNVSDAGGSGLAGYDIYRGNALFYSSSSPNYKDTGLTERTAYTYKVAAYDNDDNTSAQSSSITIYTPAKGDLNADGKINLSDLSRVAGSFGSTGSDLIGDTDGGGTVNLTDLSIVAGKFGFAYTLL